MGSKDRRIQELQERVFEKQQEIERLKCCGNCEQFDKNICKLGDELNDEFYVYGSGKCEDWQPLPTETKEG